MKVINALERNYDVLDNGYKKYIDLMKGVATMIVIATHSLTLYAPVNIILSTLHNSTFYFASGILFYKTIRQSQMNNVSILHVVKKKLLRTIWPFIVWIVLYTLLDICLLHSANILEPPVFHIVLKAANRLWFLPVLFVAFILNIIISRFVINKIYIAVLWIFGVFFFSLHSSIISKVLFFSFMVWIGVLWANQVCSFKMTIGALILYLSVYYYGCIGGGGIRIGLEDLVQAGYKLFYFLVISAIGAWMMWCMAWNVCTCLEKKSRSMLTFIGNNSLYFYIIHYISIYCFEYMGMRSSVTDICCFILAMLIPLLYIKSLKETILNYWLFGMK